MDKVFTLCISTSGGLLSNFVFEDSKEQTRWMLEELPKLNKKYGELQLTHKHLPRLKVGDRCNVWGEASDVFTIRDIIKREEYRYSFLLDSGWTEEVAKCHTEFLR
jgi:hypothetical protein